MHGNSDTLFTRLNNHGWCDTIRHTLSHQTSRSLKSSCDSTAHTPPHVKFVFTSLSSILLESLITKSFKVKPPRDKMKMILVRETEQPQKYTLQHSQKKKHRKTHRTKHCCCCCLLISASECTQTVRQVKGRLYFVVLQNEPWWSPRGEWARPLFSVFCDRDELNFKKVRMFIARWLESWN